MASIFVSFTDSTETVIGSSFTCPQDPSVWPYQGAVQDTDSRYQAFINPPQTAPQKSASLLQAGLTISSTGTPALNGTYACDPLSQSDIIAIETSLNAGKGFPPGGATTFNYPDVTGAMHTFSEASFTDLAAAIRDYVYGCKAYAYGQATSLPSSTVTIS